MNSNPATMVTDPAFADVICIELSTTRFWEENIAANGPSALLLTLSGRTALNVPLDLHRAGIRKNAAAR